jgi:kumamolisin
LCHNQWGSGGGVSQNRAFKRPTWQVGPGTATRYDGSPGSILTPAFIPVSAPNGLRQVPDLAAAAYPNIAFYYRGAWLAAGGTSAAAPIIAAGMLLVDQDLKQQGKALFGSVPEIYTIANRPGSFHPFNDITRGNNLFYRATRGWDYTTGWGSPNFNDILQIELNR